jgi:hypothetical protein
MFIAATDPNAEPSSVRAAWVWVGPILIASPIHAAPTELHAPYGARGYKHGAPNGAFRGPAAPP